MSGARDGLRRLLASVPGRAAPVSPREGVFRETCTGRTHLLPLSAIDALDRCRAFRPFAQHLAEVAAAYPPAAQASIEQGLQQLVQRGLLIDGEAWLAGFDRAARDDAPLRAVFIRTCDRPAQLERLLASLVENERRHARRHRYVVLDDSRDAGNAARHAALLAHFGDATGAGTGYLSRARRNAIATEVGTHAAARAALASSDAAGAFGGGRGYNLAALAGIGGRYVLLDDDFVLPLRMPASVGALELDAERDTTARFHPALDAALAAGIELEGDPFELASASCGRALGCVLRDASTDDAGLALEGHAPSRAEHLRRDARIGAYALGHRGHAATLTSRWMLLLDPDSRASLWHAGQGYATNRNGGALWLGADAPQLAAHSTFTPFAIDAADGLPPPTMPSGRNEDLLFGVLQHALDPRSVCLQSAATVGHVQASARDRVAAFAEPLSPVFNQLLAEHVRDAGAALSARGAGRYAGLAASLRDVAESDAAKRAALAQNYALSLRADFALRLEAVRAEAVDAPDAWRRDLDAALAAQRRALADPSAALFADDPAAGDADLADRVAAGYGALADLLDAWPATCDRARELDLLTLDA